MDFPAAFTMTFLFIVLIHFVSEKEVVTFCVSERLFSYLFK